MIDMRVAGIALDAGTRSPIVLLKDSSERRALPIFIGQDQARSIISILERQETPRPLTHDLIANILDVWGMDLEKVIIHDLRDHTFFAILCLNQNGVKKEIDCRPSDAISIALRTNSPIWVVEEVIADASIPVNRDADEAERQAFRDFVSDISPSELIKRSGFKQP